MCFKESSVTFMHVLCDVPPPRVEIDFILLVVQDRSVLLNSNVL